MGVGDGVVGGDVEQLVPDPLVEDLGDDIGAEPLDLVWRGPALAQQRGLGGLDVEDLDPEALLNLI